MTGLIVTPLPGAATSPASGEHRPEREYVHSSDLAREISDWLERGPDRSYSELARRAGVSPRAVGKVLDPSRPYQTVYLADRLMGAMGRHVSELSIVVRRRKHG